MKQKLERRKAGGPEAGDRHALAGGTLGPDDAAVIMGTNLRKSAYTLWAEKSGLVSPEDGGERARFSRDNETYVAGRFRETAGKQVRRIDALIHNPAYPFAHSYTQWIVLGESAGLTCKSVSRLSLRDFGGKRYPAAFYYSCLHQMLVTGRKKWYLAVLVLGKDFKIFEITADENELQGLALAERQFWQRVQGRVPPLLDGSSSTRKTLDRLYPGGVEETMDLSPIALQLHDYLRWQEARDDAVFALDNRAATIKSFMGNANRGCMGDIHVRWTPTLRMKLDLDGIKKDFPTLELEKYQVPTTERVFEVFRESGTGTN